MIENNHSHSKIPKPFIWGVIGICVLPFLFNLLGVDFASSKQPFDISAAANMEPYKVVDSMFYTLSGSFTHTLLEWSAFSAAFFIVILSFTHFRIKHDMTTPIIGMALFCAGCMDAFHTLAADRLIEATADNRNLIPFTWAICRLFNALILIVGVLLLAARGTKKTSPGFILGVSLSFGVLAYGIIQYCATSAALPKTMFPDSIITRPWDVGPLILFIIAGVWAFPSYYKKNPSIFSHALVISVFPQITTQLHMAFGSTALFDNHFNMAHFLKIMAYLVPFLGLTLDYVQTYLNQEKTVQKLEETQSELIDGQERIRAVVENVMDGIIIINEEGVIEEFNPAAEKVFGYSSAELVGKNITILMMDSDRDSHRKGLKVYLQTGQAKIIGRILELKAVRKNGSTFPIELAISEMVRKNHKIFIGSVRDITERKKAEEEVKTAQIEADAANRAKTEFLANISHEIRTPMNAILGYAQILKRRSLEAKNKKSIGNILSSGDHLLTLIDNILDISKIEAGRMEVSLEDFDLTQTIKSLASMFHPKCEMKGLEFKVEGAGEEPVWVNGDETKIMQVLINILGNAVKFTESGEIVLKITAGDNSQYLFDVADTGKGIPIEAQKRIYEPFRQDSEGRSKGGTGLGLAIAKRQVEIMDGQLKLVSEVGKGSQFSLSLRLLPAVEAIISKTTQSTDKKVARLAPGYEVKALVVDDITLNRDVLAQILFDVGMVVLTAENGKEAVDMVREFVPDIVFMDMRMPVMNGMDATHIIKSEYSSDQVKVVAITASVLQHQRKLIADSGVDGFISKPFRAEGLFECIKELLKIEYEYEDEKTIEEKQPKSPEIDLSKIRISANLHASLKEAAGLYQISEMEKNIKELEKGSNEGKALAKCIETLFAQYDMEGILKILEKTQHD